MLKTIINILVFFIGFYIGFVKLKYPRSVRKEKLVFFFFFLYINNMCFPCSCSSLSLFSLKVHMTYIRSITKMMKMIQKEANRL